MNNVSDGIFVVLCSLCKLIINVNLSVLIILCRRVHLATVTMTLDSTMMTSRRRQCRRAVVLERSRKLNITLVTTRMIPTSRRSLHVDFNKLLRKTLTRTVLNSIGESQLLHLSYDDM